MNVKIFMGTANSVEERDILRNFGHGVEAWINEYRPNIATSDSQIRIGRWTAVDQPANFVEYEYNDVYQPCDFAVMYGSWKPREKGHHVVRNSVASSAKNFICIETPLLGRRTDVQNQYYRAGINGFLNQSAHWPVLDHDHAQNQLDQLNIKWTGWKNNPDGHIVLALQLPGDASLRGIDINEWALQSVKIIRSATRRPIVIRSHPLISDRGFESHATLAVQLIKQNVPDVKFSDGAVISWDEDLDGAYCTVTYTSGLAIDSVLAGIPTVACDSGNFAWSISTRLLDEIDNIKKVDTKTINQWLLQLAMCQWTKEQMRSGLAWQHLMTTLETLA